MRFLQFSLFSSLVFAQKCSNGGSGPCIPGGTQCDAATEECVKDPEDSLFICCARTDLLTTTTERTTRLPATTTALCLDKINPITGVSDCPKDAFLCTDPVYTDVMKIQCPKTCGFCGGSTGSTCEDGINPQTGKSDCPNRKNLCQDPVYMPLMKETCPKTCDFCQ